VVGAAGSGKTWLAKVLAEEAVLRGVPILAVDPQGDLVQFLRPRTRADVPETERGRCDRFWEAAEPRVLTPGSSHGTRVSLDPIRLPVGDDLGAVADPQRRAEELTGMLAAVSSNLVRLARAGGEVDAQQTFVLQVLRRLSADGPPRGVGLKEVAEALHDPDGIGLKDADAFVKKAERQRLARKLNSLLHGPAAGLFSGGMPLDVAALQTPAAPGKVPLNVLYLNALTDDEQKQFFVAALAAEVYRWMVTSGSSGGTRLLFYLDEARDYIPAGARKPAAKEPLIRLFTQGRKYGVACLLCTQSPRSVDYNVFGNCSTKVVGRLESAQDAERVAEWFAVQGRAPDWLRSRAGAEPGTFVARWPGMPSELEGQAFRSRVLYSAHEGAWSPDRVEQEVRARCVQ
jgi:DNA helicase HerA-like ATPase